MGKMEIFCGNVSVIVGKRVVVATIDNHIFLFVLKGEMIKYKHWLISKISDAYKLYSDKEWGKLEKHLKEGDKQAKQRGERYE